VQLPECFPREYLQMPRESIRSLVLSAEKDAVKRFLSHVHQSWDQLQVETIQAMETMTAAFIHKFPRVTPELFVDLSQFIPYMSVSDIMSFPASLIVNDSFNTDKRSLTAIRDHSSEMKSLQKQAFAKRLLQSSVVGDVPSWPPYFLTSILPLLPHLPVSHFQQLTSHPVVECLANSSLDATRGRHVLRTLFSKRKNLTSETVMRLGILICYLNSEELHRFLSTSSVSPALWQQLAKCVTEGHVSGSGRVSISSSLHRQPKSWTVGDVEHVGRLVFTLSPQQIRSLPLDDLGKDTVEQILQSQWHWKDSALGKACTELKGLKDKIYSLIHKIRKACMCSSEPTPSCADIRGTFPSAWRWYQLSRMKRRELEDCVEFMGQDGSLDAEQRGVLWAELRPVSPQTLRPEQLLELGCIITEMGERELQAANLSDLAVVAYLGSFKEWSTKKVSFDTFCQAKGNKASKNLGVVELVSLGYLLCGFSSSEISRLDPSNLRSASSFAAFFLRETVLPCSEEQIAALTARLSSPLGFGPVSNWGSEVFTEIGTLAAGLDDMVLSALIKEQMEGLTPAAIALIPPRKMAVVFSAAQLSWLSAEQSWAVTEEQWEELDSEQKQALTMAQYEGEVMLGHRGGLCWSSSSPSSVITGCCPQDAAGWIFLVCGLQSIIV
uniref:Stereocilin n=1 Tax=Pygocentrus nattereri TaxID=42514 RepID=A0AAR2IXJ6_PYGNA